MIINKHKYYLKRCVGCDKEKWIRGKYCSPECFITTRRNRTLSQRNRICEYCDAKFMVIKPSVNQKYCQRLCYFKQLKQQRKKISIKKCPVCEKCFTGHDNEQITCSRSCANTHFNTQLTNEEKATYKRIRELKEYRGWRKSILSRDKYICQECKKYGDTVDHYPVPFIIILKICNIESIGDARNNKLLWLTSNGRVLCKKCHEKSIYSGRGQSTKIIANKYLYVDSKILYEILKYYSDVKLINYKEFAFYKINKEQNILEEFKPNII